MVDEPLDELDREILHLLQIDARKQSDTAIADETNVTSTTVANRIADLEDQGIIQGYVPDIDYEQAGYPLVVLFTCSAPIADRSDLADQAMSVLGVVNTRETMAGAQNLHVKAVAEATDRIETITEELDKLGLNIVRSDIISQESTQPWDRFHLERFNDEDEPEETGANADGA